MSKQPSAYLSINEQVVKITAPQIKIGRSCGNDIILLDILVSPHHAEIFFQDGSYFLQDLNSSSGTFLNNQRIVIHELFSNDLILIANIPLLFTIKSQVIDEQDA